MPVSNRNRRLRNACLGLLAALLPLVANPCAAQEPEPRTPEDSEETKRQLFRSFAVPDNRTALDAYDEALRAFAAGRFATALPLLQRLLDHYPNKVLHVPVDDGDESRYHGYGREVERLLGTLPPEGLALYREIYDGHAERMLERALTTRRLPELVDVVRRYRFTTAGARAIETVADVYLEHGEPSAAADYYLALAARTRDDGAPKETRARALTRATYALAQAGRQSEATATGARLRELTGSDTIDVHGAPLTIAAAIARWAPIDRTADAAGTATPFTEPPPRAWSTLIPVSFALDTIAHYLDVAPIEPTVDGDTLFVQNGLDAWAFDTSDGSERWHHRGGMIQSVDRPSARVVYTGAVHGGLYICNLETDTGSLSHHHQTVIIKKRMPVRRLVALDTDDGSVRWSHAPGAIPDDIPLDDREFLARTSVSSPPVLWEGTVLSAMSYFQGKVYAYLTAVDAETGALRWRTLICTGQGALNMFGRPTQEPVLGVPLVRDGVVYFTSNLGVVAAVDARLGRVRWLSTYPTIARDSRGGGFIIDSPETPSWRLCEPALADGVLVTTPIDCDAAVGFRAEDGRLLWKKPRSAGSIDFEFLLGTHRSTAVLSGDGIVGIDVRTGVETWTPRTFGRDETGWRGAIVGDDVLVSTNRSLHVLDPQTGHARGDSPTRWRRAEDSRGSVTVASGDTLITTGPIRDDKSVALTVFYDPAVRIDRLQRTLRDGDDAATRVALARTLMRIGDVEAGLKSFEHVARSLATATGPHESALREVAERGRFDALRQRAESAMRAGDADRARAWCDEAVAAARGHPFHLDALLGKRALLSAYDDRPGLLALYRTIAETFPARAHTFADWGTIPVGLWAELEAAALHESDGRPADAVGALQNVLKRYSGIRIEAGAPIDARDYAVERIGALIARHGRAVYARFDARADALIERGGTDALREVLIGLPNARRYTEACLALGREAIADGRPTDAIHVIRRLFANRAAIAPADKTQATVDLASAYVALGFDGPAGALIARVEAGPDRDVLTPGGAVRAHAWAEATRRALAERVRKPSLLAGARPSDATWRRSFPSRTAVAAIAVDNDPSSMLLVHERAADTGTRRVLAFAAGRADPRWSLPVPDDARESSLAAIRIDDVLVVPFESHLVAVDRTNGQLRWQRAWERHSVAGIARGDGTVIVTTTPRHIEPGLGSAVEAIEVASGATAWAHTLDGALPAQPLRRGRHVVITTRQRPATVYAIDVLTGEVDARRTLASAGPFLRVDPAGVRDTGLLVAPDGSRELELLVAGRADPAWRGELEGATVDAIATGGPGALVVSVVELEGSDARSHQRIACFDADRQALTWTRDFNADTTIETEGILGTDAYWVLKTRDEDGTISLLSIDAAGKRRWSADHVFQRGTYKARLLKTRFGLLAIGFDTTVIDDPDLPTAHIVLLDPADGSEQRRWEIDERTPPTGIRETDEGFFIVWPHRIDFYGTRRR